MCPDSDSNVSNRRTNDIRASLTKIHGEESPMLYIIGALHDRDHKTWERFSDQRELWENWLIYQRKHSKHKIQIDPTCRPDFVRFRVARINALSTTIGTLGGRFVRQNDESAYEMGVKLYWLWFIELCDLETYLQLGDDLIRKYRRGREMAA